MTHNRDDVLRWRGQTMYDNDGDKIGAIDEIYLDQETHAPEWAVVTTGLFGNKQSFVPIAEARAGGDGVRAGRSRGPPAARGALHAARPPGAAGHDRRLPER